MRCRLRNYDVLESRYGDGCGSRGRTVTRLYCITHYMIWILAGNDGELHNNCEREWNEYHLVAFCAFADISQSNGKRANKTYGLWVRV